MVCRWFSRAALVAAVLLAVSPLLAADPIPGKVTHITLYRGQALVTRTIPVTDAAGALEVVVSELPEQVLGDSLYAEGTEGLEVRAVRFRTRAVGQEPREEVRKLDVSMEELNLKIAANQQAQGLLTKRAEYLDKMEGFVAPTAKTDLAKGVLDADALQKITLFGFEQRKLIADEQLKLMNEAAGLQKQMELLQRQRQELTQGSSRNVREAVLFVQKTGAGPESVRLNYLVAGCGWSPSYTVRAGKDRAEVQLEYSALIQQMTGEDWNGVVLSLSTASPALSAAAPGLAPFHVALGAIGAPNQAQPQQQLELASQVKAIRANQSAAIMAYRNTANLGDNLDTNWQAIAAANDFQCLELINPRETLVSSLTAAPGDIEGPSLGYRLPNVVSLPSRSDQQMVRILSTNLKSRFYHMATPVLSSYVYREAEVTNGSPEDLLAGPVTVYLEGRFVGRSELPTVARGETFVVGFGADPQLRVKRELADKQENVQGGNRELSFQYRLVIENFKDEAVSVRLFDRLPYSDRNGELRLTVESTKDPLSEDKLYLRKERPKGLLRWDIEVPAAAMGEKARIVDYGFKLEFDRNFQLTAAGDGQKLQQQQQEFEELQRGRQKK